MAPGRTTSTPADGTPHRVGGPASATRSSDAIRAVLLAAALVGGYLLFSQLASLFVLVIITIVLSLPLEATATRLERHRVPRAVGALLTLIVMIGVVVGILVLAIPPFVAELQRLADQLPQVVDQLRAQLGARHSATTGDSLQRSLRHVIDKPQGLLGPIAQVGLGVAGAVGAIVVVVVGAVYMAINPGPLVDGVLRLFPPDRRGWVAEAMSEIRSTWIGWQYGVAADMVVSACCCTSG
jgi:predicted PurR-regulated permease PerM